MDVRRAVVALALVAALVAAPATLSAAAQNRVLVISVDGLNSVATSLPGLGPVPGSLWNRDQKLRAD